MANDQNRAFGAANPTFTVSYSGFATGETASVLDTVPTATSVATTSSNPGDYGIIASDGADGNYAFKVFATDGAA